MARISMRDAIKNKAQVDFRPGKEFTFFDEKFSRVRQALSYGESHDSIKARLGLSNEEMFLLVAAAKVCP